MYRQFNPTPLICPCCGCVIGEQAYFQSFEAKAATWLQARMAPPSTKGYDVYDSALVPNLTFQVKYAVAYQFLARDKQYPCINWTWMVKRLDATYPDFFIFFGLTDDKEYCFLISREDFVSYAISRPKEQYILRVSAKMQSDRKGYVYTPKIWRYLVKSPETLLAQHISSYQPKSNESIFAELNRAKIIELQKEGLNQYEIAKELGIGQSSVSRLLRKK